MSTMPPLGTPGYQSKPQFEFTPEQNEIMAALSRRMRLVGLVSVVFGILGITVGLAAFLRAGLAGVHEGSSGAGATIQGIVNLLLGVWLARSATSFRKIATTQGQDINHLMEALRHLAKYFGLLYILILISLVLLAAALVIVLVVVAHGASG